MSSIKPAHPSDAESGNASDRANGVGRTAPMACESMDLSSELDAIVSAGLKVDARIRRVFRLINDTITPLISCVYADLGAAKPVSLLHRDPAISSMMAIQIRQSLFDKILGEFQTTPQAKLTVERVNGKVIAILAVPLRLHPSAMAVSELTQSRIDPDVAVSSCEDANSGAPVPCGGIAVGLMMPADWLPNEKDMALMGRLQWLETLSWLVSQDLGKPTDSNRDESFADNTVVGEITQVAAAIASSSADQLIYQVVNNLTQALNLEQASIGLVEDKKLRLIAISGVSQIRENTPASQQLLQVMAECLDNDCEVSFPFKQSSGGKDGRSGGSKLPESKVEFVANAIHQNWSRSANAAVGSIPIRAGNQTIAIFSWLSSSRDPISTRQAEMLHEMLAPLGAALPILQQAQRTLPQHLSDLIKDRVDNWLKSPLRWILVISVVALSGWVVFGTMVYRPRLKAELVAAQANRIGSPVAGTLKSVSVREGQRVRRGDVLFEMDTEALELQRDVLLSEASEVQVRLRDAIANELPDEMAVVAAHLEVVHRRIDAIDDQIKSGRVTAPFDAIVAVSDLETQIGHSFDFGGPMMELIAEDAWKVKMLIPDEINPEIELGQSGVFVPAGRPDQPFAIRVETHRGIAEVIDGQNVFVAHGRLDESALWMRSGITGTVRVDTRPRSVIWILFHTWMDRLRLMTWY